MVPPARWWSRARGLPPETYQAWRRSLAGHPDWPARVLSWAPAAHSGYAVGSPAVLSVGVDTWSHVAWHEIEHGTWNAETQTLSWRRLDGRRAALTLPEAGRIPELFRERVAASIVLERFVALSEADDPADVEEDASVTRRGVTISARRSLAGNAEVVWHASLVRGTTWSTPGARETADAAIARLRAEYDATPP